MAREPTTDDCKSQGTRMTLDSYFRINDLMSMEWNPLEGGHYPPSTNMRYSETLYNVEEINKQDVHELVILPGMAGMQSQDN